MNGYFQLEMQETNTSLHLYPPTDGGKPIDVLEIKRYLELKQITFDLIALNEAVQSQSEKTVVLNHKKDYQVEEMMEVHVSDDLMTVYARFYAPSKEGKLLNKNDILFTLKNQGIKYGYDEKNINFFLEDRQYCTEYIFAKGTPARQGKDAEIHYEFETDHKMKPALREDGSVDFFQLGIIQEAKEGQLLAVLTPEDLGEAGTNVKGEMLKPKEVKSLHLEHGNNVRLSEDKLQMFAASNGQIRFNRGVVSIENVLELAEVGTATGNISFNGSVHVKGNVATNFSVKASCNVQVDGIVEAAKIEAGGDIIIARGMNGMGKGELIAGGNIIVKFLENANCQAGGYVQAEAIMQSNITAKTDVEVCGKKGFIAGGLIMAGHCVKAKKLGSEMGIRTNIEVGTDPTVKKRIAEVQKSMEEARKKIQKATPIIQTIQMKIKTGVKLTPEQVKQFRAIIADSQENQKLLEQGYEELEKLEEQVSDESTACVISEQEAYPGVRIVISGAVLSLKSVYKNSKFIKDGADVKLTNT